MAKKATMVAHSAVPQKDRLTSPTHKPKEPPFDDDDLFSLVNDVDEVQQVSGFPLHGRDCTFRFAPHIVYVLYLCCLASTS